VQVDPHRRSKGLQRSRPIINGSPGGEHTAAPATVFFEDFRSKQSFPRPPRELPRMGYGDGSLVKTALSRGSFNLHWFSLFNAISFQIMMGAPIIVYAKSLGASSTTLGIIAAFTPLMTVFQLPAAQHLHRFGYRQFVLMGWGMRNVLVFLVAVIPLARFLDDTSKLAALLALLFFWLPWTVQLIPEEVRGRFLSVDQVFMYFGCLLPC
jgi:hypothetical protein